MGTKLLILKSKAYKEIMLFWKESGEHREIKHEKQRKGWMRLRKEKKEK
jgi:hypothetical protein